MKYRITITNNDTKDNPELARAVSEFTEGLVQSNCRSFTWIGGSGSYTVLFRPEDTNEPVSKRELCNATREFNEAGWGMTCKFDSVNDTEAQDIISSGVNTPVHNSLYSRLVSRIRNLFN